VRDRDAPGEVPGSFKVSEVAPAVFLGYHQRQIEIAAGKTNRDCQNERDRGRERDGIASRLMAGSARSAAEESPLSSDRRSHCG
jgi:hypothetical protein